MFCQNCGVELPNTAKFCSNCGFKIENAIITTPNETTNNDYNTTAIKIYLSNILSLECMRKKLNRDWHQLDRRIKSRKATGYCERFLTKEDWAKVNNANGHWVWFKYDGKKCYIAFHTSASGQLQWINEHYDLSPWGTSEKLVWYSVEENFKFLNNKKNWLSRTTCPTKEKAQVRDKFLQHYETFKANAHNKHMQFWNDTQSLIKKLNGIYDEHTKVTELLNKAYNVNIIPKQFRNLQAIYFLHDYISTSNETLSSAFLHCDLDVIKQKLDIIIEQQEEIIIGQAILAAQNKELISRNQQALDKLSSIEENTSRSAQYAEIAANNAEACAWIGLANYIKN